MKFIKDNIASILLIAVAVLLTLQISAIFKRSPAKPTDEVIKAKDELIKFIQVERQQDRAMFDSTIAALLREDAKKVIEYKTTKYIYEKIPANINRLNNDELRRAITEY